MYLACISQVLLILASAQPAAEVAISPAEVAISPAEVAISPAEVVISLVRDAVGSPEPPTPSQRCGSSSHSQPPPSQRCGSSSHSQREAPPSHSQPSQPPAPASQQALLLRVLP
jgi:hypothetical protein